MAAVFVHGVPDTHRVWDEVIPRLARTDARAVSLPGFDSPVPEGFGAAKEDYVAWLVGELEAIGEPVDLVGHDWGALLVLRTVSLRGDLIRTWTAGGAPLDPDYVWHEAARAWQTPEVGEQMMAAMTPEATAASLATGGLTPVQAQVTASHIDARMQECILKLYRSAKTVGTEWTPDLAQINRPGLLIYGAQDPYLDSPTLAPALARRTGADLLMLEGCGHWWESERPDEVVAALERHWASA